MTDPKDATALAKAANDAASVLVAASQALVHEAHKRFVAKPQALDPDGFAKVVNHHATIASHAASIRLTTALDLGGALQPSIEALSIATDNLKLHMASLADAQDVIGKITQVLVTAGSLVTFVAAPSAATLGAAVTAVKTLAN